MSKTVGPISGRITDVFCHRFVVERDGVGRVLADLGPEGEGRVALAVGQPVELHGEQKKTEIKVSTIRIAAGEPVTIVHGAKNVEDDADPAAAIRAVETAGFEPVGEPRRKPKHFEILARHGGGYVECHVAFDGLIRKEKPVDVDDDKWASVLKTAA